MTRVDASATRDPTSGKKRKLDLLATSAPVESALDCNGPAGLRAMLAALKEQAATVPVKVEHKKLRKGERPSHLLK